MKKAISIIVVIALLTVMCTSVFAANYNFETEPNDDISTANLVIPLSQSQTENVGQITATNDGDFWYFYATKRKNHAVGLISPSGYSFNLVVWEMVNGDLMHVASLTNSDFLKVVTLPGAYDDGTIRKYYIVVYSYTATYDAYRLLLQDNNN